MATTGSCFQLRVVVVLQLLATGVPWERRDVYSRVVTLLLPTLPTSPHHDMTALRVSSLLSALRSLPSLGITPILITSTFDSITTLNTLSIPRYSSVLPASTVPLSPSPVQRQHFLDQKVSSTGVL
ncbi:hypothetical protein CC80DRAFT_31436 [Byssothecium circinans]|uniref:Secreted protein n=1 Tax=Byssothecium circinans TaxID=147558 RepID=A0A6A5U3G7_9PLEO|nr:hypothetical protein CC80DRAFT_31436 [Byssothecium circinans]